MSMVMKYDRAPPPLRADSKGLGTVGLKEVANDTQGINSLETKAYADQNFKGWPVESPKGECTTYSSCTFCINDQEGILANLNVWKMNSPHGDVSMINENKHIYYSYMTIAMTRYNIVHGIVRCDHRRETNRKHLSCKVLENMIHFWKRQGQFRTGP